MSKKLTVEDLNGMKLYELGEIALRDLEALEQMPNIVINMGCWIQSYRKQGRCEVCLAGAVLYRTLGKRLTLDWNEVPQFAAAINGLRQGDVSSALFSLGRRAPGHGLDKQITPYRNDSGEFKAEFRALITQLRRYDL